MPFERIQTLLADSHYHTRFKNTSQAFHYVCINHGYRELYRGLTPILLRNGPSNVLFFIIREEAAERLPKHVRHFPSYISLDCLYLFEICIDSIIFGFFFCLFSE